LLEASLTSSNSNAKFSNDKKTQYPAFRRIPARTPRNSSEFESKINAVLRGC